ncbi:YheC/YheD family protein [Paenibacillus xerothermodurans]|uniref:YheC/YheD family protein n=1 Tax=Paenibacillus xerothermodurans TaxID=1977292 RepID=A0A2W1NP33_PAEXE|nr:YheC/YheD family protein [Paenibacillus xerothermodurans]PZE19506.1 hypothetical protein CBW46_018390 [Paenibacillus xerothermodurans]
MKHKVIRSKMKKGSPLMADPIISRYVPKTDWLRASSLKKMLRLYPTVYIKPDIGRKGDGVVRVKKLSSSTCEISYKDKTIRCSSQHLVKHLRHILDRNKRYLVQQGIQLATYHGRPFDLRVVLHRPRNRWHLTWASAKVAPRKNSVVTNVAKGAKDMSMNKAWKGLDQPLSRLKVMTTLIDVSYQIAQILGSRFPFKILGLDMAIDKKGRIWFIEANTQPDPSNFAELDPKRFRKYRKIEKLTERG